MQEIKEQVERFIELSRKFSKTESELFGHSFGAGIAQSYHDSATIYTINSEPKPQKTKAEQIMEGAQERATLANEFDEYKSLQNKLTQYFNSLNNLTKVEN